MPSYIVYVGKDWWIEGLNALKPLGEAAGILPDLLTVRSSKSADEIRRIVREAVPKAAGVIVAEVSDRSFEGNSAIRDVAELLEPAKPGRSG